MSSEELAAEEIGAPGAVSGSDCRQSCSSQGVAAAAAEGCFGVGAVRSPTWS